ncbi:ABC-F family ATP-binding cassette domain-containing protein [Miniimonas arenae]|uniref:ABC-F family ATP-binding cassette domain-containing protein n=1 Tax=Miniimonas arenae TaxID=676201 RepID=A0A5C5BC75_9MICO|nr:ATP-binding cassette domain-containing protein [Miniimonas arenae]TNU73702.1 ABC-F family ATP-binding cassette domain-containing protein [Miniimonas arenae]
MTTLLRARDVAFAYPSAPGTPVLARLGLTLRVGDRLGVVGENGSGKSTLLGVLAGDLAPTAGDVERAGSLAVVPQEMADGAATVGDLVARSLGTARAAAARLEAALASGDGGTHGGAERSRDVALAVEQYEASAAWDADRLLDEALTRFGAPRDPARPLAAMSVGERYRVRLACRLAEGADAVLLDEPTNHLDPTALAHLTQRIRTWPGGVIVVTHDRQLLDDVATAVLDLDPTVDGVPARYGARRGVGFGYADYRRAKRAALARWRTRYRAEQERLAELFDRRDYAYEHLSDEWRPPKGSKKNRRGTRARQHVKAADRAHARLERTAVDVPPPPPEIALPALDGEPAARTSIASGGRVLALTGAVVPGRLDRPDLAVELGPGGRLLVVGPNGAGKSTLLALLAAAVAPDVRVGYLAQEAAFDAATVGGAQDVATARILAALEDGSLEPDSVVPLATTGLVAPEDLDRPVAELSVGRRRRLDLALTLMTAPHVLVLDEPTNHLAVDLMDALTAWLREVGAAVVVATHDRRMRADLADWPTLDLG